MSNDSAKEEEAVPGLQDATDGALSCPALKV